MNTIEDLKNNDDKLIEVLFAIGDARTALEEEGENAVEAYKSHVRLAYRLLSSIEEELED